MRKLSLILLAALAFATPCFAAPNDDWPAVEGQRPDVSQCDTGASATLMARQACQIDKLNEVIATLLAHLVSNMDATITPNAPTDGSTTITAGGTAQQLFSGATPPNGFALFNPDAAEDCWWSDTTTAAANGTGSHLLTHLSAEYVTPQSRQPISAVSIVCATTGHKLTASYW